ncbi:MAG TPA: hypothetical protein VF891_07695 [Gaiellaceae bacterium]
METGNAVRESSDIVAGWRAWVVTETAAGLRLASVLHDLVWPLQQPALAECRRHEDPFAEALPPHPVPGAACNCGFHAARDPVDALSYARGRDEPGTVCRVLGEVSLWGHVVETEAGWRASHAYPVRLYVADPHVVRALAVYGVPVLSWPCGSSSGSLTPASSGWSRTSSSSAVPMRS